MKTITLTLCFVCIFTGSTLAATEMPAIITDGLDAYQKNGARSALAVWLKGSPLEFNSTINSSLSALFSQAEGAYGSMTGFETIRVLAISPSARRVYLLIKFEKGPLYAWFDCYKVEKSWIVPMLECNTRANLVLPSLMLSDVRQYEPNQ